MFGEQLRELRADKSMSYVAKACGISVVYYSEVERGIKPPFCLKKFRYCDLANVLCTEEKFLRKLAMEERQTVDLDISRISDKAKRVAMLFGCRFYEFTDAELDVLLKELDK